MPRTWCWLLLLTSPELAMAHGSGSLAPADLWHHWNFHASVTLPLLLAAGVYTFGICRLWRQAGIGRVVSRWRAVSYAAGLVALLVALVSPLDAAAKILFSLHMVQHLLLILVAPPLLIIGAPDVALLWALSSGLRSATGRTGYRFGRWLAGGKGPVIAVLLATGVLWAWHLPQLYDLAVRNDMLHWAEHAGFLLTAVLFWASVLRLRPREHTDNGLRILYVFAMALQGSILGALLTFASRPLYASHAVIDPAWGLKPLADQQLAGLIMWVPPALLYIGVTAYLFTGWLQAVAVQDRLRDRQRQSAHPPGAESPTPRD